ncbi:VIT1/CCC1 family predicted Fe2+/Mn2+ transporter [Bradyrhizobium barranii subsp. barranii]
MFERGELAQIYVARGVEAGLAREVSKQLMAKDALSAHARDELGISEISTARPVQAALASAATFSVGAVGPLALVLVSPSNVLIPAVAAGSLLFLSLLGAIGAKAGGAGLLRPTIRVAFWGACAMALTAGIGAVVGKGVSAPLREPLPQQGSDLRRLTLAELRSAVHADVRHRIVAELDKDLTKHPVRDIEKHLRDAV